MGAGGRPRRVVARDVERRAFVEHERDVRPERRLDRHRVLRAEEPLTPVEVRAEADALLLDRQDRAIAALATATATLDLVGDAAMAHREDLKAAGVGDDRPLPAHELVQAPELLNQVGAGGQEKVEGVAQDHLVAELRHLVGLDGLDRRPRRQWHERGRAHLAMDKMERSRAGERVRRAGPDREHRAGPYSSERVRRPTRPPGRWSANRRSPWAPRHRRSRSRPSAACAPRASGHGPRVRRARSLR